MTTRLFVSSALINGADIELDGEAVRYLGKVLRAKVGDPLQLFDGSGPEHDATIVSISRRAITLNVGATRPGATESPLKLHLVQGISRGERMDLVVQKATELGVKRITPVQTEFGVVKFDAERATKRREHWQKVAISACEQSGRTRVPLIDPPLSLNAWFGERTANVDTDLVLLPGAHQPLRSVPTPTTKVCLLIGPEGGFSQREIEDAAASGFKAVSLGPRILRTETAAIAALTVAQSTWGDLRD